MIPTKDRLARELRLVAACVVGKDAKMDWLTEHNERRERGFAVWRQGATIREVAVVLGVSPGTAAKVVKKWKMEELERKRAALSDRMDVAILLLSDNGFSDEDISLICNLTPKTLAWKKIKAEVSAGRRDEPLFLEVSQRAQNVLDALQIATLANARDLTIVKLMAQKNCGTKTAQEIKDALAEKGVNIPD